MIQKRQLAVAIAATFVAAAVAQAQPATQKVEKVEITGSLIKRVDAESSSPIQVITRADIERSGATTIAEVLQRLPATNAGTFNEANVASFSPGASSASLRGLGGAATLVLINGRRIAPFGFASGGQTTFVDLNGIPLSVTERIEVLLDGASAIYGSDAMAGVINIITRKDYKGIELSASGGTSSRSDGSSKSAVLTAGTGSLASDGYNVFGSLSYGSQDAVYANQRPLTVDADYRRFGSLDRRSTYSNPGNAYNTANTTFIGALAGCTLVGTAADAGLNGRCLYDFAPVTALIPKAERLSVFAAGLFNINNNWQLFSDLNLSQNKFTQGSASYNVTTYGFNGIILPANNPQNTFGRDVAVRYRLNDVPLSINVDSNTLRATGGIRGVLAGWDVESAVLYSGSNTDVVYKGFTRDSVLENGLLVDGTNRVAPGVTLGNLSADLKARLYPNLVNNGKTSTTSIDARATRELMQLSGGAMAIAIGADYRRESFKTVPDKLVADGDIGALGTSSADGSRNVSAAFVELSAPIFQGLETQFAGRIDSYSDFGSKFTPKVGFKWKPLKNIALRGTYAEGFRAPSLTETSGSPVRGFYSGIRDPKLCPVPVETNPNCSLTSIPGVSGSNPNLKPETSKSFTLGVIVEPVDNISVAVDYYDIKRTNEISSLDTEYLLANENLYPKYVTRDSTGVITGFNLPYENLGSTHVRGFDLDIKTSFGLGEYGKIKLGGYYNYMPDYFVAPVKGAKELNYAGTWQQPRERFVASLNWARGPWDSTLTWNRTGAYLRAFTPSDLTCALTAVAIAQGQCAVRAHSTSNIVVRYSGFKDLVLGLSINNIEDRQPPLDQRRETRFTWYSPNYHSAMGRFFRVDAKYTFR
jgi:iron complex outermembrane recepter protein